MTMDYDALVATGQWRQFRARLTADEEDLRKAQRWSEVIRLHALDLTIAAHRGAFDQRRCDRLRRLATSHNDQETTGLLDHAAGLSHLAVGDTTAAWQVLRNLTAPLDLAAARRAYVDVIRVALAEGQLSAALRMLSNGPHLISDAEPMTTARVSHAHALWATESGTADPEPFFERALHSPLMPRRPMEHARLLLDYGRLLKSRRRDESRAAFREALNRFEWLTAAPWAAQARAELRAAGVRVPGEHTPSATETLTAHSLRILRLAAEGLSNRDIGERLSISPRTVASHLYRAFPLVGVRSRRELPRLFAGSPPDGASPSALRLSDR
ncbi:LuxR C-terminal-related transcriptional regulator [Streptomyces sp. GESEQ-35]|uniref:helix-turn-helix transcriptional regulator n=1 Tax=Streptomyces sp. GESEQ-35 TaxID=2812657 RepID=UPI001B3363AE|nr:LuxR C-terminal-related transcriptional regulator [Streptomyces sp. GESEQ-35]